LKHNGFSLQKPHEIPSKADPEKQEDLEKECENARRIFFTQTFHRLSIA
jgi:hypothetical protein